MKYLKIYENYKDRISFIQYINRHQISYSNTWVTCNSENLVNLDGIENFTNLKNLNCSYNSLKNLKGIENLINLEELKCSVNELKNLNELEKLTNIKSIYCVNNDIENLDVIKNLPNLKTLYCKRNPFKYPLPIEIVKKFYIDYDYTFEKYYRTYEKQKEFLTKYPERIMDLEPFGFHEKIKEEFADLIEGSEFGFFNLR